MKDRISMAGRLVEQKDRDKEGRAQRRTEEIMKGQERRGETDIMT